MGLFNKKPQNKATMTESQLLANKYNNSANNILLVVVFTLINSALLFTGSDSYFLFSAAIPYYFTLFGLLYTGRMPADWYEGWDDFVPDPDSVLVFYLGIAIIAVVLYALCWLLAKKKGYGWLVVALVMFVIDTAGMFYYTGFAADMILDIVFHGWVIVSLVSGISTAKKLKKLTAEAPVAPQYGYIPQPTQYYPIQNVAMPGEAPVANEAVAPVEAPVEAATAPAEEAEVNAFSEEAEEAAPAEMPEAPEDITE